MNLLSDILEGQLVALEAVMEHRAVAKFLNLEHLSDDEIGALRLPPYLHETLPVPTTPPEPLPKMILLPPLSLTHRLHRALARLFGGE